jgi:hypothetical protein
MLWPYLLAFHHYLLTTPDFPAIVLIKMIVGFTIHHGEKESVLKGKRKSSCLLNDSKHLIN